MAFKTEIIVRTVVNLRSRADVAALVAIAAQHGVGTINLAAKPRSSRRYARVVSKMNAGEPISAAADAAGRSRP